MVRTGALIAVLACCGCRHTWGEYLVPVGAAGTIPSGAGTGCTASDEGVVSLDASRFKVIGEGRTKVRCSEANVFLEGRAMKSLRIAGPASVVDKDSPFPDVSAEAVAADGRVFDLALLDNGSFEWSTSPGIVVKQARCGDMAPLCAGGVVGNGRNMRLDVRGPGAGTIDVKFLGQTAQLALRVDPARVR